MIGKGAGIISRHPATQSVGVFLSNVSFKANGESSKSDQIPRLT